MIGVLKPHQRSHDAATVLGLLVGLLIVLQRKTILGKYAAAIGGNRLAAELSGINAVTVGWVIYIIVGFFAALAGVARASYMSLCDPLSGDGMETACIIAVLLTQSPVAMKRSTLAA